MDRLKDLIILAVFMLLTWLEISKTGFLALQPSFLNGGTCTVRTQILLAINMQYFVSRCSSGERLVQIVL